jgi:Tfp pilus assembly protein PilO
MALKDFKFENLPPSRQILVFAVVMAALIGVFYSLYMKAALAERDQLQTEVRQLEASVAQSTAVESQLKQFKREVALLEERLAALRSILPAQKETPIILRSVQEMASSSSLKINKFTPQAVVARDFYSDWPIVMEVQGCYNALGKFFEKVSRATRIINVENITIKGINNSTDHSSTLTATCTATTFVFREDQVVGTGVDTP